MKRILIVLALLMVAVSSSFGQFNSSRLLQHVQPRATRAVAVQKSTPKESQADSALYMNYTKRNGWIEGIGRPLTPDEASHLTVYFKLSHRNAAGHWTLVQALNGFGKLTTSHGISTYLISKNSETDQDANKDWQKNLRKVCQWEFVSDENGREVLQEVGMDADGQVVYCFVPVKVGDHVYAGSYVDAWGMPVFMRTDSLGNDVGYANFVQVTRDARGYERLIQYTDRYGYPQRNKDGAYMSLHEHDDAGNIVSTASLNIMGERMIDAWGNCGWKATHDDRGNVLTEVYTDAQGKPIRIKGIGADTISTDQVIQKHYKRDQYGRLLEVAFFDAEGQPDVNQYGVHRVTYSRSRYGYQSGYCYYGLNNQLVAGDTSGVAKRLAMMDDTDNLLQAEYFGADGYYAISSNGYCKTVRDFRGDEIVNQTNYIPAGDTLLAKFHYEKDSLGNELRAWYQSDLLKLDSVDSRGNETSVTYYNLKRQPITYSGIHRYEIAYTYGSHSSRSVTRYLDEQGRVILPSGRDWSKCIIQTDSLTYTIKAYYYRNDTLIQAEERLCDMDFKNIVRRYDINEAGERSRSGYDDTFEYCWKPTETISGQSAEFSVVNEFDEPAYLTTAYGHAYHYVNRNSGSWVYFDVHGNSMTVSEISDLYRKLPKAYCVEVTDKKKASQFGFQMGDVILSYGDWSVSRDMDGTLEQEGYRRGGGDNWKGYLLETVLKAHQPKVVTVLRHYPQENRSEVITLNVPAGRPSELGFYAHLICYTEQEHQRLLRCADEVSFVYGSPAIDGPKHTIVLMNAKKASVDKHRGYWFYNVKDPAVLLQYTRTRNMVIPATLLHWTFVKDKPSVVQGWNNSGTWWYTNDGTTVTTMPYAGQEMDTPLVEYEVSDSIYNQLAQLYSTWQTTATADVAGYDWQQHRGNLTIRQVAKHLESHSYWYDIFTPDVEKWSVLAKRERLPWTRQAEYSMECFVNVDDYEAARHLIENLDKSGYTQEKSSKLDLLLVRRTGGKKHPVVHNVVCVRGGYIFMADGELTPNYYKNLINWLER